MKKLAKLDEYRPRLVEEEYGGDNLATIEIPVHGLSDPTITDVVSNCVNSKDGIYAFGQEWTYVRSNIKYNDGETVIRIFVKDDEHAKTN